MKNPRSIATKSTLRSFSIVFAIFSLGMTGCSSLDTGAEKGVHAALIEKMDPPAQQLPDDDVVAASRDWYQMID
jgi:hypothetical protein